MARMATCVGGMLIELQKYTAAGWTRLAEDDHCVTTPATAYAYESPQGASRAAANPCVAPLSGAVALRGGRGWLLPPKSPDNLPGRLTLRLNLPPPPAAPVAQRPGRPCRPPR